MLKRAVLESKAPASPQQPAYDLPDVTTPTPRDAPDSSAQQRPVPDELIRLRRANTEVSNHLTTFVA